MTKSDDPQARHPAEAGAQPSSQSAVAAAVPPGTAAAAGGLAFLVMTTVLLQTRRQAGGIPADLPPLAGVLLTAIMAAGTLAVCSLVRRPVASARRASPAGEAAAASFLLSLLLCSGLPLAAGLSLLPEGATVGLAVILLMSTGAGACAILPPDRLWLSRSLSLSLPGFLQSSAIPGDHPAVESPVPVSAFDLPPAGAESVGLASVGLEPSSRPAGEPSATSRVLSSVGGILAELEPEDTGELEEDTEASEARVIQWTRRTQDPGGGESVVGSLQSVFPPGQRTHLVHLVFAPPLSAAPSIECEVISDSELRCRVAASMPWGARIELRRSAAAATAETGLPLELEYFATSACLRAA